MDIIYIRNIKVDTLIGIYEREKVQKQPLSLSFKFGCDVLEAAMQDNIAATVDYEAVTNFVIAQVKTIECGLIETLAEKLCAAILENFAVAWVECQIEKPEAIQQAETVGVIIKRARAQ